VLHGIAVELGAVENTHDDSASAVSALMLRKVVTTGELLATVSALEGLVVGVKRAVVALEVLLAAEASRAKSADEGLGRIFSQRLLAAATASRRDRSGTILIGAGAGGVVRIGRMT